MQFSYIFLMLNNKLLSACDRLPFSEAGDILQKYQVGSRNFSVFAACIFCECCELKHLYLFT